MGKRNAERAPLSKQQPEKEEAAELHHDDEEEENGFAPPNGELNLSSDDEDADAVASSGTDDEGEGDEEDGDVREAMADYMATAAASQRRREQARARATGDDIDTEQDEDEGEEAGRPLDPGSDSSEDERENRNTVGDVPLEWYKDEDHIGYDLNGKPIAKSGRKDRLAQLVERNDGKSLRTIYDEYNDEEITLTRDELKMIMAIRKGHFPSLQVNPYEPYVDWFSKDVSKVPILDNPVPKRRFIPSKHEEKKIVKLVRAIRKGWLKTSQQKEEAKQPEVYLLWGDDGHADSSNKTGVGLSYIPPAKPKLPGHAESYNPPGEYVPTEEEVSGYQLLDEEDRPKFVPQSFKSLREVPMYSNFIKDVFERCLDLYLCPRVRRKRLFIEPEALVPKLPKPQDLQPFPTHLAITYSGHTGKVRSCCVDPSGQWLLSGGDDGTMRVWEVRSGRCMHTWQLNSPVHCVAWCPTPGCRLASAACGNSVVLLPSVMGGKSEQEAQEKVLSTALSAASSSGLSGPSGSIPGEGQLVCWSSRQAEEGESASGGLIITHKFPVRHVTWHARGDYLASVAPTGNTQSVLVHQISKGASQNPFKKNRGRVPCVLFHPTKPFFFVAAQNHVYVYNLAKQALAKRLLGGSGTVTCMAVHPSGDHVLAGGEDKRLAWYDLDLSDKPYKALRYHTHAVRGASYHPTYPLFASCADDGTAQVFHGMVYSDLMTNPLLVPLKVLRGHARVDAAGVLACAWHPTQPWLVTAGADGNLALFCN